MRYGRRRVVGMGLAAGLAMAAGSAQAADRVDLLLNWYLQGSHAQFFLGRERGFYADEGIELNIAEGRGSARAARSRSADRIAPSASVTIPAQSATVPATVSV